MPRLRQLLIALTFAIAAVLPLAGGTLASGPTPVTLDPNLPVHPLLQYGAQVDPGRNVSVLIELSQVDQSTRGTLRQAHADVKEQFPFINSVSANVAMRDIPALSKLPSVRYIAPDGSTKKHVISTDDLQTLYDYTVDAPSVWNNTAGLGATGQGVTVAVLDTGINGSLPDFTRCAPGQHADKCPSVITTIKVHDHVDQGNNQTVKDGDGHGTHVAGIIDGLDPQGKFVGIAPDARILDLAVADDQGQAQETDVLRGLQWVYDHAAERHIRVVNMSLAASVPTSYHYSPVDQAVEQLWRAGVTVVAAAGNSGTARDATWFAPGNDPYVLTVGALDDSQAASVSTDTLASFSSRGKTQDGIYKPDVVAPGRRIVSVLAHPDATVAKLFPARVTADRRYIRLSGTSMSTPVVTGTIALLLERFPTLTPDQIKGLLVGTARTYAGQSDGAGAVDALRAMQSAAAGNRPSGNAHLAPIPAPSLFGLASLDWVHSYWDQSYWDHSYWDQSYWDQSYWDQSYWDQSYWDQANGID